MGRRSINTTKSGKYMNPTDQARKMARKRELKKNKKQRMMVRHAVLKSKDPKQILVDMEKLDQMEFDSAQPIRLNEKVLRDKRKKLRETFDRVLKLYEKEDPTLCDEMKRMMVEYERRRQQAITYFESVKHAQQVTVEDIPLPEQPDLPQNVSMIPLPSDIPLPGAQPHSILKKTSAYGYDRPPPVLLQLQS
ncbi:WW domain-binding protein 11-like [Branchiostoma floridae]|uniref:WW domain-binding protein 11-like n=1 Tax=Branchiostoma floridae TaxID=7739 RepID=A0A9J7M8Z3_BRAFL|nr:WW domain-binding protein 11-like [Branchiostoma floridae]